MASKYLQKFPVPDNFYEILHDFAREIIRDQPEDILEYGSDYFEAKLQGKLFSYEGKYNIKRSDQNNHKEYHPENQRKGNVELPRPSLQAQDRPDSHGTEKAAAHEYVSNLTSKIHKENSVVKMDTETSHGTEKDVARDYISNLINKSNHSVLNQEDSDVEGEENPDNFEQMEDEEEVQESGDEIQGEFYVQVLGASNLKSEEAQSETYCVVFFSNQPTKIIKTPNSNDAKNPEWNHLDKFVLKLDKSEFFDIQLVVQIFNFENGKTLIGENLLDPLEIFENPSERKEIKMKLKNSDGEDGDFGEVLLLASWVKNEGNMPQFKE